MRMLMIGPPGAGKGTQAARLAGRLGLTHLSSGDLLRAHVESGSDLGREVRGHVERGDLVPDAVLLQMLRGPVAAADATGGYVLDGFPRTVDQAGELQLALHDLGTVVEVAVFLSVPDDVLVARLSGRGRGDDTDAVVHHRLAVYREKTVPLLDHYAGRGALLTVDGAQPVAAVTDDITAGLRPAGAVVGA